MAKLMNMPSFRRLMTVCILLFSVMTDNVVNAQSVGSLLFGSSKPKKNYIGQYADNAKDKTGTAMQLSKNGDLYVGDFHLGKYSGYGMMIVGENSRIKNAPGTAFYVGEWIDNKKNGRGSCYAADGDLIYKGNFLDDVPTDPYPTPRPEMDHYFSDVELPYEEYFIGELKGGVPDGFGIFILPDGTKSIGRVRDGVRYGISLLIGDVNDWMLVKWNQTGKGYTSITSTTDFDARRAQYAAAQSKINAELRESLLGLASETMQLIETSQQMRHSGSSASSASGYVGGESSDSSSSSRKGKSAASKNKGNDCGSAWMSASRTYSDYESQLVPNGARTATNESDRQSIKSKMRQLRQKWEKRGCPINKSPYEN